MVGAYNSSNYKSVCADFMGYINNDQKPTQRVELKLGQGAAVDTSKFGHITESGNSGFSWIPWFSFGESPRSDRSTSTVLSSDEARNCSVVMTYKDIRLADITPGTWYVHMGQSITFLC